ncbi:ribosome small subunit-dependent GTPase A [soil metagenome]
MTNLEILTSFGWNDFFAQQLQDLNEPAWLPARVVGEEKNLYRLQLGNGEAMWGEFSGRFYHTTAQRHLLPTTGDWVACVPQPISKRAIIHACLARQTYIARKIAGKGHDHQVLVANVNTAFITTSLNLDFNLRRIERYLTLIKAGGATPVILLTKADIAKDAVTAKLQVEEIAAGANVHVLSTVTKVGLTELRSYVTPTQTVVFLGSSGVGKSSLVNYLLRSEKAKTAAISSFNDKGRHTTSARYLFQLPEGGMVIDTPGVRELQMTEQDEGLNLLFDHIHELALQCRFSNCQHNTEPDCRIIEAIANGELKSEQMQYFLKLQQEITQRAAKVVTVKKPILNKKIKPTRRFKKPVKDL